MRFTVVISIALGLLAGACGDDERAPRAPNDRPSAILDVPAAVFVGDEVFFDASQSTDPDGRIVEYRFAPGVGDQVIISADPIVPFSYDEAGDYVVRLTVIDDAEGKDAIAVTVSVLP